MAYLLGDLELLAFGAVVPRPSPGRAAWNSRAALKRRGRVDGASACFLRKEA
jgi:hypothetical protein